ncbi:MAG: Uma2 family endonuclease [Akkermansiaceae bacterium]|nr:Uma2 family endonuclease [Armatimonadota bacterium]
MSSAVLNKPSAKTTVHTNGVVGNITSRRLPRKVDYPEGDGKPMAETPEHGDAMYYAVSAARAALDGIADVYVAGNNFVYYVEGDVRKRVSPDCYVVLDVPRRARRSYKTWEDGGRTPNVVWEFTSRKTAKEDREDKFVLYEQVLKVPEYFLFDPLDQYLKPRLQGYRLNSNGAYIPVLPDVEGRFDSEQTGIKMFADGQILRFVHPSTGAILPTYAEAEAGLESAKRNRAILQNAEAEIARLRAEIDRLKANG